MCSDGRYKWPDSKRKREKKDVQESLHSEFQHNRLQVRSSFQVLVITFLPLVQLIEAYGVEVTALIS